MRYTIKNLENFAIENLSKYESSSEVRRAFRERGINVIIDSPLSFKTVENYYKCSEDGKEVPMKRDINFERTYHIFNNGNLNFTATSMNDGSNFLAFLFKGSFRRVVKIA